jgi:RimJ/RimL family protein N-acetyltransferase
MAYFKKLIGTKCYLSPCSREEAEKWTQWDNDLEVAIPLGDEAYTPYTLEKMQDILDEVSKNQSHIFSIVNLETDTTIGRCLLFNIDHVNRQATLGIVIGEKEFWGKGYGQDAIKLLLDYGFNLLNLNSIMIGTFSFNERAQACFRKVGFKEIGRRREARIIGEKKFDLVLMDMVANEFESTYMVQIINQKANK